MTLAYTPSEASGLLLIAEDRGFFAANGVKMIKQISNTGVDAMEALLKGEVDIAGMSEVPLISQAFAKQPVSIYANFDKLQYIYLIGRKDRGIETAIDLKGKRIGVPMGTIAQFYLGRFLELNGLSLKDVTPIDTLPAAAVNAMSSGGLDGAVVWNPSAYQIRKQMADSVTVFHVQSSQSAFAVAVARNNWLADHEQLIERSLKAIAQAEQYSVEHPIEARAIVQKQLNYDDTFMESVWSENEFSLSLDQALMAAMEDESRWMIANNLTPEKIIPDFGNYVYEDALKAVKPGAVNFIR
ncbi:MAG TPA: NrtA/SsuA/CpmA family ABC transporter substrate-binding protein [Dehalococcoidales bacterium]